MLEKKNGSASSPEVENVDPYLDSRPKSRQVEEMFDSIAPAYDFMNTAMTFGLHKAWRDKALGMLRGVAPDPVRILDVATGTGDVAFRMHGMFPEADITGIDLSEGMLEVARKKARGMAQGKLTFKWADCLSLPFPDNTFDAVTVAYGVRNFQHLDKGYSEMLRVLKPSGTLCVIELSEPANPLMKTAYRIYARGIIPLIGRLVSGDSRAYSYLPESIAACPQREGMTMIMRNAGFRHASFKSLTFGAVTIYMAQK